MSQSLVCLLIIYFPNNNFSVMSGRVVLGLTSTKQRIKYLAQGHKAVSPVSLEPTTPRSQVKHSTTEPPRSSLQRLEPNIPSNPSSLSGCSTALELSSNPRVLVLTGSLMILPSALLLDSFDDLSIPFDFSGFSTLPL